MIDNGRKEPRNASGMVLSLQARVGRHREQPARFRRLAEGEEDATFRDKWVNLALECASLARRLQKRMSRRAQGGRLTRGGRSAAMQPCPAPAGHLFDAGSSRAGSPVRDPDPTG
jgi:hypothetical protein